jgi:hypothetical protein
MNKILAILLLSCGLISCNSCSKNDTHTTVPPTASVVVPPPATTQLVKGDSFQFVIPADWSQQSNPLDTNIKAMYSNNEKEALLMLASQPFLQSQDEFVLLAIRDLRDNGVDIGTSNPVVINGQSYVFMDTEKDNITAYMWLTVKDGIGYQFTCGSRSTELKELCTTFANTLEVK